jgi:hypothetical protein
LESRRPEQPGGFQRYVLTTKVKKNGNKVSEIEAGGAHFTLTGISENIPTRRVGETLVEIQFFIPHFSFLIAYRICRA